MKRREAIRNSAFLVGCGLSAGTIASIATGCKDSAAAADEIISYLDKDTFSLLGEVVETIIPKTDTPGAKEAGVGEFIDNAVSLFTEEEQGLFTQVMEGLKEGGFMNAPVEEREKMLLALDDVEGDIKPYSILRGLVCQGYFTSEIGATQALSYLPIPGEWVPCIELSEVGKAWAL